ncbi:MAG TPA: TraV family lipoprotein [Syntrophorhabdus sp.]|jgi:conjugal transfer pilus assembly protein TraV|nr:TraV family lipoprotein [Syntrophorhabdus sp.]HQP54820.1 TraV family lipoprotein [Syntrophorhabdus sp.]
MRAANHIILTIALALILSSCSIFNPYNSEFQCRETYKGECLTTQEAYQNSIDDQDIKASEAHKATLDDKENRRKGNSKCVSCSKNQSDTTAADDINRYDTLYKKSLYSDLKSIIDEPQTPVVRPPEVLRILLLGYTDPENFLYSYRYMYIFTTDPKWIFDPSSEVGNHGLEYR